MIIKFVILYELDFRFIAELITYVISKCNIYITTNIYSFMKIFPDLSLEPSAPLRHLQQWN